MKNLFVFIFLLFLINILSISKAFAQFSYPTQKQARLFLERTLIVKIFNVDETLVKSYRLKTPEKIEPYKKQIAEKNKFIKENFQKHWKLHKRITFKSAEEIAKIVKSKDERYAIFVYGNSIEARGSPIKDHWAEYPGYSFAVYLPEWADGWDNEYIDKIKVYADRAGTSSGRTAVEKGRYLFKISLVNGSYSQNDFIFMIEQFNYHIPRALEFGKASSIYKKYFWIPKFPQENIEKLKEDTLLFDAEFTDIKPSEISTYYKYPLKVVSREEIDRTISEGKEHYAYLIPVWDDVKVLFSFMIAETDTHKVLAYGLKVLPLEKINLQELNKWVSGKKKLQPEDKIRL